MNQRNYNIILQCIKYGAPAIADDLINDFNTVVMNSNELVSSKLAAEREAQKAAAVVAETKSTKTETKK